MIQNTKGNDMTHPIIKAATALPLVLALGFTAPTASQAQEATALATAEADAAIDLQAVIEFAGDRVGAVVAKFQALGYHVVDMSRTLLGRIRLTLENAFEVRQIVVSRSTGEIMYDATLATNGAANAAASAKSSTSVSVGVGGSDGGVSASGSVGVSIGLGLGN
jgi:hypothetical protein